MTKTFSHQEMYPFLCQSHINPTKIIIILVINKLAHNLIAILFPLLLHPTKSSSMQKRLLTTCLLILEDRGSLFLYLIHPRSVLHHSPIPVYVRIYFPFNPWNKNKHFLGRTRGLSTSSRGVLFE